MDFLFFYMQIVMDSYFASICAIRGHSFFQQFTNRLLRAVFLHFIPQNPTTFWLKLVTFQLFVYQKIALLTKG